MTQSDTSSQIQGLENIHPVETIVKHLNFSQEETAVLMTGNHSILLQKSKPLSNKKGVEGEIS